eukprot:TRINITY_DN1141_c0_g1_i3.p1 TRINITY_DN1141_c0_g1~~TRINITY_DN1141_c0_g1_i3.p1  ORF type:complete len:221 (+),score=42.07 TRINITY_DN1141_c0_g1_i3:428-1090(+)
MSSTDPSTSTEPDTSTSSSTTDSQVLPEETSENIYVDDSVQKLTLGDGTEIEITVDGEHLSCVGQDIQEIPIEFGESYGDTIKYLDLSYNQIKQLTNLDKFTKLDTLCVDNNELISEQVFPELSSLASLSLNNNNVPTPTLSFSSLLLLVPFSYPQLPFPAPSSPFPLPQSSFPQLHFFPIHVNSRKPRNHLLFFLFPESRCAHTITLFLVLLLPISCWF